MIKVGKSYKFEMWAITASGYEPKFLTGTVTKVENNLVEIDGHTILNVQSHAFSTAIDQDALDQSFADAEAQLEREMEK